MKTRRCSVDQRRGGTTFLVVTILVTVALISVVAVVMGGGNDPLGGSIDRDQYIIERGSFEISMPASGELAALNQIEIRNRLEYRAIITELVEEGTYVKKGDMLVRLAEDEIETKINDAEDTVNTAGADAVAAQSKLDIRISAGESEVAKADLAVMLAKLALEAWEQGEVVSRRQDIELELKTAQMDFDRLLEKYEESKELVEQRFISEDEFSMDEINMIQADARLKQAQLDEKVYEQYEFTEAQAQKQSDLGQALAEQQRVADRLKADLETHRATVASKNHRLGSVNVRLDDLREQLVLCSVAAPSDGLVVYAASLETHRWSRGDRGDLQVGGEVRKNELLMVLPDVSEMTAEVKVNESLTGLIEPGQRVTLSSDALPETTLTGEVLSIGVLAESGGWRDPNRRDYTVKVMLLDIEELGLKPSMRCKAEIYVGEVQDAIYVPLQAVFREGSDAFVYIPDGSGFSQRRVDLGRASGLHVEITDGLSDGEVVLLREPKVNEIVARLPAGESSTDRAKTDKPRRPGHDRASKVSNRPRRGKGA